MWQAITEHINSELDSDFQLEHKQQLTGGSINLAWHVSGKGQHFFVKLNQREQNNGLTIKRSVSASKALTAEYKKRHKDDYLPKQSGPIHG